MRTRLLTSTVIGVLTVLSFLFYRTIWFDIVFCTLFFIGMHEIIGAIKPYGGMWLAAGFVPIMVFVYLRAYVPRWLNPYVLIVLMILYYCTLMVAFFPKLSFEKLGAVMSFGFVVFIGFFSPIYMKWLFRKSASPYEPHFYFLLAIALAWGSDSFAYLTGRRFGKRKLSPLLSPHKTVEGLIGGVAGAMLCAVLIYFLYVSVLPSVLHYPAPVTAPNGFIGLLFLAAVGALLGVIGDLFASSVKRQAQIKDYGTLFPGHGGVLDRFDSLLVVAPFVAIVALYFPIFV